MSVSGALKPPPGEVVDYTHSVTRGYEVVNASLFSIAFAAFFVVVRLAVKFGATHSQGWDDYSMVIALLFAIAQVVGNVLLVKRWGVGHHSWDVPLQNYEPMLNWIQINTVLYLVAILFAKLSILLFYNRLFGVDRRFRWVVYCMMTFVVGYCVSIALAIIFQCTPPSAVWNLMQRETAKCTHLVAIEIAIGAFNIPSDFILLALPFPMVARLQMPLAKKIGLMVITATGIFVCVTAIIREIIVKRTLQNRDEAWTVCDTIIWLTLEVNVGILCGCLPSLNPIFRFLSKKGVFSSAYYRSLLSPTRPTYKASSSDSDGSQPELGGFSIRKKFKSEKQIYRPLQHSSQNRSEELQKNNHQNGARPEKCTPREEAAQRNIEVDLEDGHLWRTE